MVSITANYAVGRLASNAESNAPLLDAFIQDPKSLTDSELRDLAEYIKTQTALIDALKKEFERIARSTIPTKS